LIQLASVERLDQNLAGTDGLSNVSADPAYFKGLDIDIQLT